MEPSYGTQQKNLGRANESLKFRTLFVTVRDVKEGLKTMQN